MAATVLSTALVGKSISTTSPQARAERCQFAADRADLLACAYDGLRMRTAPSITSGGVASYNKTVRPPLQTKSPAFAGLFA